METEADSFIQVRVPHELKERLEVAASENERTVSGQLRYILYQTLDDGRKKEAPSK